ncbi:MAG: NAD-dependent epimerase/dehydratase family protein, partial [Candidatus Dormibacteraceae bacterium]
AQALILRGCEVHGLQRGAGFGLPPGVRPLPSDLEDSASIVSLPQSWDWVIHLAGASVPSAFATTAPVLTNLRITLNLLEHLQEARVLLVSSCHVYAPHNIPHQEEDPIVPQGRYGLSKHLVEQLMPHYLHKLDIRVARPFNHLGPGQRPELVVPSLLRRLRGSRNATEPIFMRGMDSIRDFIDVRDVVEAYLSILDLDPSDQRTFNVCTGKGQHISEVIEIIQNLVGSKRAVVFEGNPNSSDDIPALIGSSALLRQRTTWIPRFSLRDSLDAMYQESLGSNDPLE